MAAPGDKPTEPWSFDNLSAAIGGAIGGVVGGILGFLLGGGKKDKDED